GDWKSRGTTRLPSGLRPTALASGWRPDSSKTRVAVTGGDCGASVHAARPSARAGARATTKARIRGTLRDNRLDAPICRRAPRPGGPRLLSLRVGRRDGVRERAAIPRPVRPARRDRGGAGHAGAPPAAPAA